MEPGNRTKSIHCQMRISRGERAPARLRPSLVRPRRQVNASGLLREVSAVQEGVEAGVGVHAVESGVHFKFDWAAVSLLRGVILPSRRPVLLA